MIASRTVTQESRYIAVKLLSDVPGKGLSSCCSGVLSQRRAAARLATPSSTKTRLIGGPHYGLKKCHWGGAK
ncbi:hypothetical protein ES703_35093 [subsurface metagenome]